MIVDQQKSSNAEIDSISCANPVIKVHFPKTKVDGITRYVEDYTFTFDESFNENEDTREVYNGGLQRAVIALMRASTDSCSESQLPGGVDVVTVFAYG